MSSIQSTESTHSTRMHLGKDLLAYICQLLFPREVIRFSVCARFTRDAGYERVLWKHLAKRIWPIDLCGHTHDWRRIYRTRMNNWMRGKRFICTVCSCTKAFIRQDTYKSHLDDHLNDADAKASTQSRRKSLVPSPKRVSSVGTVDESTQVKLMKCPEPTCTKQFPTKQRMLKHYAKHTGLRPFACKFDGCDKSFDSPSALKCHSSRHTGNPRPHRCLVPGCGKSFNTPSALRKHKRSVTCASLQ